MRSSPEDLEARDYKDLYRAARTNPTAELVGQTVPIVAPREPHLTINNEFDVAPSILASWVLEKVSRQDV